MSRGRTQRRAGFPRQWLSRQCLLRERLLRERLLRERCPATRAPGDGHVLHIQVLNGKLLARLPPGAIRCIVAMP